MGALAVLLTALTTAGVAAPDTAEAPVLHIEADRGSIEVGDPLRLELWLEAAPEARVELPGPGAALGDFELLAHQPTVVDTLSTGRVRHRRAWSVTAYRPGPARLPPLAARVGPAGPGGIVRSDTLTIDVLSVLAASGADSTAELRPLKAPVELPVPPNWWLIGGIAVAVACLALGIWLWRRRRRGLLRRQLDPIDLRPPDEWALEELARLRREDLPARKALKEHYTRLADILRPYLERRFLIHAADRTTHEILRELAEREDAAYTASQADQLGRLFAETDLVKFARHRPPAGAALGAVDTAVDFVQETRRGLAVTVTEDGNGEERS